ncbi:hypothetical protein [Acinetobacter pittii]|uniref:hypothetical protein n=1 Tax=Acinetobacter pittii TaxID=48296 RepID=UPI0019807DF8|nr:hypothetical protein [Acinetobacter pittii]MBN6512091.1 hypothetical protein [Acinetobacter pittii]
MKNIAYENKGILNPTNKVKIFGRNFFVLQVIFGVVREKRVFEFIWGIYCFLRYKAKKSKNYKKNLDEVRVSKFKILEVGDERIVSRSWVINENFKIYVEYGQPGARIIFKNNKVMKIYDPYKDDCGIYHIHNIIHLYADKYLVSTGDSSKYLDEFVINRNECRILKRHLKHLGGFTASININSCILMGTDFSYRPNYIFNFSNGEKYFLPKEAWLEYIIDIEEIDSNSIEIFTKQLNENIGHKLLFNISSKSFISVVEITINEEISYEII